MDPVERPHAVFPLDDTDLARRQRFKAPGKVRIVQGENGMRALYRVHIGPLPSIEDADQMSRRLAAMGLGEPHVVIY